MAIALVAFMLGGFLLWHSWRKQEKVKASMSWPHLTGHVVAASVRQEVTPGDADNVDSISYFPLVEYEYQVGSRVYRNSRFAFQENSYSRAPFS